MKNWKHTEWEANLCEWSADSFKSWEKNKTKQNITKKQNKQKKKKNKHMLCYFDYDGHWNQFGTTLAMS